MGVTMGAGEKLAAGIAAVVIKSKAAFYSLGLRAPVVAGWVDRRLNARLAALLDSYGHADFVTDPDRYAIDPPG